MNYGLALMNRKRLDEAESRFRRSLEIWPRYHYTHTNLAIALFSKGDFAVASDHAVNGSAVRELGLPRTALIAVINRGDETIPPRGSTVVEAGDRLFVLIPRTMRADLEDVFARWRRRV